MNKNEQSIPWPDFAKDIKRQLLDAGYLKALIPLLLVSAAVMVTDEYEEPDRLELLRDLAEVIEAAIRRRHSM